MAYATAQQLVDRYDIDLVGELATDGRNQPSRRDIKNSSIVATALNGASADVDVALRVGKRYLPADLANLDEYGLIHLADVVCCLAMCRLFRRRPAKSHEELAASLCGQGNEYLKQLREGTDIFGLTGDDGRENASVPSLVGPTTIQKRNRNFLAERMSGKFLPNSIERTPIDRG